MIIYAVHERKLSVSIKLADRQHKMLRLRKTQNFLINTTSRRFRSDFTTRETVLAVQCKKCDAGWKATGTSALNFITHSPAPRNANGDPYMSGSGFNPNQIEWINQDGVIDSSKQPEFMPEGSSNPHYFCGCDEKTYLGLDATRLLGAWTLSFAPL